MPTNVSKPIWRCDICGERFGEDERAAARCESAGQPYVLPGGTLMLDYEAYAYGRSGGFYLRKLFNTPSRMGTLARTHHQLTGHTLTYTLDLDPALYWDANRGYYRWPNSSQPSIVTSDVLWPNKGGKLQLRGQRWLGHHAGVDDHADYGWLFDAVGLPGGTIDATGELRQVYWARPLTEPVVAVLDELRAYPQFINERLDLRRHVDPWLVKTRSASLALNTVGRVAEGRPANTRRTLWYLRGADEETMITRLNAMWREWRGGTGKLVNHDWDTCARGDYDVPAPRLKTDHHDHLTASKLSKRLKALVAATGIEWPARTIIGTSSAARAAASATAEPDRADRMQAATTAT